MYKFIKIQKLFAKNTVLDSVSLKIKKTVVRNSLFAKFLFQNILSFYIQTSSLFYFYMHWTSLLFSY